MDWRITSAVNKRQYNYNEQENSGGMERVENDVLKTESKKTHYLFKLAYISEEFQQGCEFLPLYLNRD